MVSSGEKTAAAARLFKVHPGTISRLLARHEAAKPEDTEGV